MIRRTFAVVFATGLLVVATSTQADIVLGDDFTNVATNGGTDTATIDTAWDTVSGINAPSTSLVFVGNGEYSAVADLLFHNTANEIAVDYNLSNEGSWYTTIEDLTLDAGTASIDLTSLSLLFQGTTNSGGVQTNTRNLQLTVEVFDSGGSLGSNTDSKNETGGAAKTTYTADLTGITLVAGETYDIVITVSSTYSSGINASIDDLSLVGDITPIPEPAALALMGLGGLLIVKRRRD
jgi:hypothetical protein